jgi:hypothetical protein
MSFWTEIHMSTFKIVFVATAALVGSSSAAYGASPTETVFTADQHSAMAHEFQEKATAATAKAEAHEVMARVGGSPKSSDRAMAKHCERLIAQYRAEADTYAAKATEHQGLATK